MQDTIYEFTDKYPEAVISAKKYSHEDLYKKINADELEQGFYQRRYQLLY